MIFTSYYSNSRNFPTGVKTISISIFPPKWFKADISGIELAPSKELLLATKRGEVSNAEYEEIYIRETLSSLNPKDIYRKYNGGVFLCYETPEDFCHRQIVLRWLREAGFDVTEMKKETKVGLMFIQAVDTGEVSPNIKDKEFFEKSIEKLLEKYKNPTILGNSEIISELANKNGLKYEELKPSEIISKSDTILYALNGTDDNHLFFELNDSKKTFYTLNLDSNKITLHGV